MFIDIERVLRCPDIDVLLELTHQASRAHRTDVVWRAYECALNHCPEASSRLGRLLWLHRDVLDVLWDGNLKLLLDPYWGLRRLVYHTAHLSNDWELAFEVLAWQSQKIPWWRPPPVTDYDFFLIHLSREVFVNGRQRTDHNTLATRREVGEDVAVYLNLLRKHVKDASKTEWKINEIVPEMLDDVPVVNSISTKRVSRSSFPQRSRGAAESLVKRCADKGRYLTWTTTRQRIKLGEVIPVPPVHQAMLTEQLCETCWPSFALAEALAEFYTRNSSSDRLRQYFQNIAQAARRRDKITMSSETFKQKFQANLSRNVVHDSVKVSLTAEPGPFVEEFMNHVRQGSMASTPGVSCRIGGSQKSPLITPYPTWEG